MRLNKRNEIKKGFGFSEAFFVKRSLFLVQIVKKYYT